MARYHRHRTSLYQIYIRNKYGRGTKKYYFFMALPEFGLSLLLVLLWAFTKNTKWLLMSGLLLIAGIGYMLLYHFTDKDTDREFKENKAVSDMEKARAALGFDDVQSSKSNDIADEIWGKH